MSTAFNDNEDFLAKWLNDELSAEEKIAFEQSEDGKAYLEVLSSVEKLALPPYDVESELAKLKAKKAQKSNHTTKVIHFGPWRMAAAAVIVIGCLLGYFLTRPHYEIVQTLAGVNHAITLPDNSTVTLNSSSQLKYKAETFEKNRQVMLEGEAFFHVTKGIGFEVKTEEGTVRVLGTSFNVKKRDNILEVVCYTGKVNVSNGSISRDLMPGDAIRLNAGVLSKTWTSLTLTQPSWIEGIITLNDVSLAAALDELKNTFNLSISSDIKIDNLRYNGSFPNSNVDTAIQLVLSSENIEYTYNPAKKELKLLRFSAQ